MSKYLKIFIFSTLFLLFTTSGFSQSKVVVDTEKVSSIELTINGEKTEISNMPQNVKLEIFSIIGSKVATIEIKNGIAIDTISLAKGYYIVKGNSSTRKIAVK